MLSLRKSKLENFIRLTFVCTVKKLRDLAGTKKRTETETDNLLLFDPPSYFSKLPTAPLGPV